MDRHHHSCLLITSFTGDVLAGYVNNDKDFPAVKAVSAPFNQVIQVLMDNTLDCWRHNTDFVLVWTQPENVIESFNHIIAYNNVSIDRLLQQVDDYSRLLLQASETVKALFVPTWVYPAYHRGLGIIDITSPAGLSSTLMRMNFRLAENLSKSPNVFLFDAQRWLSVAKHPFVPKLWYMGKIAFGNEVFEEAVKDIKGAINAISGNSKKLIVLDLDDTLWGGIVGDIGWENLTLGGHHYLGEAYVDFQRALKAMTNRGVLLCMVSKNEESVAIEAIEKHAEMILKLDDFAGWKINWHDKAQNIVDLVAELNLGLQSTVFIDDNPFERARVREALPEVYVPDWPKDKTLYKSTFLSLRCFDTTSVSKEDLKRSKMYAVERQRKITQKSVGSIEEWLQTLDMKIAFRELDDSSLQRTVQLLNKTNQMNLTTRRMIENDLLNWLAQDGRKLWTFRVSDRFGDSGLTGILSLEIDQKIATIIDFVLSCRVMGRKVEETMLYVAIQYAKSHGLSEVRAEYLPTPKNAPCLEFWKNSDFRFNEDDNTFIWNTNDNFSMPRHIEII